MSQKFLSSVALTGISNGSILKVNSSGEIVAAVAGTDYVSSATTSQWTTSGNDIYYNTGNVGIGESSPDGILHLKGSSQATEFYIESSTGTASTSGAIKIAQNNRSTESLAGEMVFYVQDNNVGGTFWREAMAIINNGNVGIGNSSPGSNRLKVTGATDITGTLTLSGYTAGFLKTNSSGTVSLDTNTYLTTSTASTTYLPLTGGTVANGNNASPLTIGRTSASALQVGVKFSADDGESAPSEVYFGMGTDGNPYWASTANLTAGSEIWHAGNDGAASGLDADLLDGNHASAFASSATFQTFGTANRGWLMPDYGGNTSNFLRMYYEDGTNELRLYSYHGTTSGTANLALYNGSSYVTVTPTKIGNWDTAYGWGNHASAGYITSLSGYATTTYVDTAVSNLVDSAPTTLNTLNELAAALGDDASFSSTVSTALGNRLRLDSAVVYTTDEKSTGRSNLGLGSAATSATTDFAAASHNHDSRYYTETEVDNLLAGKASTDTATTSKNGLMSSTDKSKLDGIAAGAEVNVQADWNQTTTTSDDYIKNKPTLGTAAASAATDFVAVGGDTMTGDLQLGSNQLLFGTGNVAAPSTTDQQAGTRILLYPISTGRHYAIGIESDTMWFNSDNHYKWYSDTSSKMTLNSSGNLTIAGTFTDGTGTLGSAAYTASTSYAAASHTHTNADSSNDGFLSSGDYDKFTTAFGWGNHSGLYLPLSGGTVTGSTTIEGDLTVGKDGTTPQLKLVYDDNHASGAGWNTLIELGSLADRLRSGNNFPTYLNQTGYGLAFQANSDGVVFGMEEYSAGNFRPVIAWGDDASDTPFNFRYNGSVIASLGYNGNFNAVGTISQNGVALGSAAFQPTTAFATSDLATESEDGLMSSTDKSKLDGIDSGANNYSLPLGTSTTRGGFKVGYTESGKNYPVELSNEQMYVNVPWTDTDTTYSTATSTTLGLVKIGYTENGKNYPVELSSGQMFVNVPWTDTNTTYSVATTTANGLMSSTDKSKLDGIAANANNYSLPLGTSTTRGGFKVGYTESGKNYPVELSNEQMYVNVPWTDTDTTYDIADENTAGLMSAADKTKLDGIETGANNYVLPTNVITAGTYGSTGNSTKIDSITVDSSGRVTAITTGGTGDIDGVTAGTNLNGGGTSGTPTLNLNEFIANSYTYQTYSSNGVYLPMVKGGLLTGGSSSVTGRLRIKLPHYKAAIMQSFIVDIYEYNTDRFASYMVAGYSYSNTGATWYNTSAICLQDSDNRDLTVYFGADTTNGFQCVSIGEVNSTWVYPNVVVRNYMGGHDASTSEVLGSFTVEFVTSDSASYSSSQAGNTPYTNWNRIVGTPTTLSGYGITDAATSAQGAKADSALQSIAANSIGAGELNVSGNGTTAQYLRSDGDGSFTWATPTNTTYSTATSTTLGLVKIGYTENGKNYPVELSSGQMYVNVPWTDTNTTYEIADETTDGLMSASDFTKLQGVDENANNYSLPLGTSTTRGGFKVGYTESGKNYPVELSSEQMYVNVPWTDTDTTYSAGAGISLSGTTFNVDYPVRVLQNQNYAPSDGTSSGNNATNRANFGTGLTIYEGYSTGSNRPFTYDTAAQFMVNANQGFEFAIDWVSGSSTPIKIRSLRDCCQGWSSWSTIWTSSTDGSGSGLDADLLDGNHASAFALSAHSHSDATTSASGFMSSTDKSKLDGIAASANNYSLPLGTSTTRGGFKVGYTESGKNYPVELSNEQMYVNVPWTDTDTTYNIADSNTDGLLSSGDYDKFTTAFGWGDHASAGYLTSVTNISGYSGTLIREDNRTISPSELTAGQMKFGFTSWGNNNSSPYADFLHLRSYTDSSGGSDNLVMFKKSGIGMRIWQQTYGSTSAYSSYADVYTTNDFATSDFVAVSGDTMTGTLTASGGINGLTLANGGISGSNFNITGVNQLEIADPGEGIVFKGGASGDITLAIIDDTTDNILNLSGTGAKFRTPVIQLNDASTVIQEGANNSVNITTATGSIDIGSMNASWVHIQADRDIYILPSTGGKVAVDGNLTPYSDNAKTLGASGARWSTIYGVTGTFSGDVVAYSDARVKENVETIETPLDKVMKLRGVSFNRTGEDRKNIGVIAQEIREVLPEVVHEQEDGMLAVAYGNIVGLLIEAMKEQQQQIDELKSMLGK